MILTLTLNPAVDKTIVVRDLAVGRIHRVSDSQLDPAGKGINVTRVADRLGWPSIAFGFLAGEIGMLIARALDDEGVQSHFVRVPGQTRLNVTVFDEALSTGTSFYDRGPKIKSQHLKTLEEDIRPWLSSCKVFVMAGSIPPGIADSAYAHFLSLARSSGTKTILDSDAKPMRLGVEAGPYLIKPNLAEMERLVGRALPDAPSVIEAAREVLAKGVEVVVVSMGAKGAICVKGDKVWRAIAPTVQRRSTVGSGDSMVAGLALSIARGEDIVEGLRLGTAAGAATAMTPGTALGSPTNIASLLPLVQIETLV